MTLDAIDEAIVTVRETAEVNLHIDYSLRHAFAASRKGGKDALIRVKNLLDSFIKNYDEMEEPRG